MISSVVSHGEEALTLDASLNKVLLKCQAQHLSPLKHVVSDLLTSISGGTEVSEGGGHWCLALMYLV